MKPVSSHFVPAFPGFFVIYADDINVDVGEPIIAWRIDTFKVEGNDESFTQCFPITTNGDPASNWIGIQNPDRTVDALGGTYVSLAHVKAERVKMAT